jgi:hypothetical protein
MRSSSTANRVLVPITARPSDPRPFFGFFQPIFLFLLRNGSAFTAHHLGSEKLIFRIHRMLLRWAMSDFATRKSDGNYSLFTRQLCALTGPPRPLLFERKDLLPVVPHADDGPVFLFCLDIERGGDGADLGIGQPLRRTISVLTYCIVVQYKHR